jgi:hypothetical protein
MIKIVSPPYRIQWETFSNVDRFKSDFKVLTPLVQCSDELIPIVLSNSRFRMYRYQDTVTNFYKIGYGYGNSNTPYGMTESEAYGEWIAEFKKKESSLQKQLPIPSITVSQFDALLSLYFTTGSWRTIESDEGIYDISSAIKNMQWSLVADMIANGKVNRTQRQLEAKLLMLGDYRTDKSRNWLRNEGIQYTRTTYIRGITDALAKKQAEISYYRQTMGTYLPNLTENKKREISNLATKI